MKTLKDLIISARFRKGTAHGTTKRGAYWTQNEDNYFCCTRRAGGEGIGQSGPDIKYGLDFRHFRSGEVHAVIVCEAYHQNTGKSEITVNSDGLLGATTAEDVIIALKGIDMDGNPVLSKSREEELTQELVRFGLPACAPAPDEEQHPTA
jgi:hypothetical protein